MDDRIQKIYSLTGLQTGIYYSKIKDAKSSNYHLQTEASLMLKLTQQQVRFALDLLSYQYEVLKTAFVLPESTGVPRQVILADRTIPLITMEAQDGDDADALAQYKTQDLRRGFDLQKDSLIRVAALFNGEKTYFVISVHHIILDGWSLNLLLNAFVTILHWVSEGKNEEQIKKTIDQEMFGVPEFSEYVKQTQLHKPEKAYQFWGEYLSDVATNSEVFGTADNKEKSNCAETVTGSISKERTERLTQLAVQEGFTVNTIAEAAWGIVLQKYSYADDVVFARILSGRDTVLPRTDKILGLLIKSVPCRVKCQSEELVTDLCKSLYLNDLKAMEYSDVSLSDVQEHSNFHTDYIHSVVAFENYVATDKGKQCDFEIISAREETDYPVSVSYFQADGKLQFNIICDGKKYAHTEMTVIRDVLQNILTYYADHPDCRVCDIDFVDKYSDGLVITDQRMNNSEKSQTLIRLLKKHVDSAPNRIAVECREKSVTYRELWKMSERVAAELTRRHVKRGQCVVIFSEKCIEFVAAVYGILMAGCSYTVISNEFPLRRQELICRITGAKLALFCTKRLDLDIPMICMNDAFWDKRFEAPKEALCKPDDIAQIVFTSGSTGEPKGVCITHSNLICFFHCNCVHDYDLGTDSVFMQISAQTFDASAMEIHGTLTFGGKLVLVEKKEFFDPTEAKRLIRRHGINKCFLSTSLFNQMAEIDHTVFDELEIVGFGGEACNVNCVNKVLENNQNIILINFYGPTETTCYVTKEKIERPQKRITIGTSVPQNPVCILNGNKKCSVGMNGEICVLGPQLGKYLSDDEAVQRRFVDNPFGDGRMYRTGDVGRLNLDGKIEFLGRQDNQIKLRGYRIELNEIEEAIRRTRGITAVAVKLFGKGGDGKIVGYYSSDIGIDENAVRAELKMTLPAFSVPSLLVRVEKFELNQNGKIDKSKLKMPENQPKAEVKMPKTADQKKLCAAVEEVLGKPGIGIDEDLFEIGMNSIKAMKLLAITKKHGYHFTVSDMYSYRTIECLCEHLIIKREIEESDSRHAKTVRSLEELKDYLQQETKRYESDLINRRDVWKEELLANQVRVSKQANIMSGIVVPFEEEFNIERLTQSVLSLLNRQDVLRTTCRNGLLVYKSTYKSIQIPYLNLKESSDELRSEAKEYFTTEYYKKEEGPSKEIALHRMVAVKYSESDCRLYIPVDHMIFDAVSGEIITREILRHYYDPLAEVEEVLPYREYGAQLGLGPKDMGRQNMSELLNLKEFASALADYAKKEDPGFKNYVIQVKLRKNPDLFAQDMLWNYAYRLFLKMVGFSVKVSLIPYVSVCINREYCGKKFYNTVGMFVDVLPFVDTVDAKIDYKAMRDRIRWLGKHNISAISMISSKKDMAKYPGVAVTMLSVVQHIPKVPVFNFLGLYSTTSNSTTDIDVEELLKKEKKCIRTVDVKVTQDGFSFLVFCKEGKKEELKSYMQSCLDEMMNEDGIKEDAE